MTDTPARLVAIQRMDVFREVVRRIEQYIEANHLQAGDRLPSDRDLAAALEVSRPLVRQALKALESLGRVSAQQGSGTYVQDASHRVAVRELTRGISFDRDLLEGTLPARIAIESAVLRAAFERRTPETVASLRRAMDERERQLPDDPQEAGLDLGFEAALGRACGNELLRRLQALVHDVWLQAQIGAGVAPGDPATLHHEHRAILAAFERGDLHEALDRLSDHLRALPHGG
jgi:GntR family transcriptional regulator, transcriptional repressor for pyruvate dehydrogenase complex